MKYLLIIPFLLGICNVVNAQVFDTANFEGIKFQSERALFDHAFQNTDLVNNSSGLFLDYCEYPESVWSILTTITNSDTIQSENCFQVASIMNKIDLSGNFNDDSLIYPIFDHFYSLDGVRTARIPILVFDVNISRTNQTARENIENWNSSEPFPEIANANIINENYFFASLIFDSIVYDNVTIFFDPATVKSNRARQLEEIHVSIAGYTYILTPGMELDFSQWSGQLEVQFDYYFSDSTVETKLQSVNRVGATPAAKSSFWDFVDDNLTKITWNGDNTNINISNPEIQFAIKYGCEEGILKKPFIIIAGWGPYTDKSIINNSMDWPTDLYSFGVDVNTEGFLENLHDANYDIVLVKFFPPNASIHQNSELLETVINIINAQKFSNNSYEENIIMGYSAGALCAKYTLQRMEKKHLEQNAQHPHTKLFVSFDGENQGANIPLGLQHEVIFLKEFLPIVSIVDNIIYGYTTYALRYILDAPLSKQLLHYFHSATGGNGSFPGQGAHPMRGAYLNQQAQDNHSMNTHIPGYPSFGRNISISNGSSTPNYNFSNYSSNHYPYPNETNATIYYQLDAFSKYESKFITHGTNTVFYYGRKYGLWLQNWMVHYQAVTKNPLVLDNAPGGIIFIEDNPIISANNLMKLTLPGSPDIDENHLYSFTPTVLTHDIKNFNAFANGGLGYMNYNFKTAGLNYDNEFDVPAITSNTVGYPHLGHPGNHYTITPFDALFTWNENTVHVRSGRKSQNYYEEEWSPARGYIKNFIVQEGEHWNIMLQNINIGGHTNGNIIYRVDYKAENEIWFGEHVTQKTDFLPSTVEDNTVAECMAANAIFVMPGFHAKPGSEWHAFIGEEDCLLGKSALATSGNTDYLQVKRNVAQEIPRSKALLIPNPAHSAVSITFENDEGIDQFHFYIYNLSGNLVQQDVGNQQTRILLNLEKGIYLVKIKTEETWFTEKLIIEN